MPITLLLVPPDFQTLLWPCYGTTPYSLSLKYLSNPAYFLSKKIPLCLIEMPILRRFSFLGDRPFFIPRGSGNLEPIPWGPRGICGE